MAEETNKSTEAATENAVSSNGVDQPAETVIDEASAQIAPVDVEPAETADAPLAPVDDQPTPAVQAAENTIYTENDGALRAAWRRLLDYDNIAYSQKKNYIDLRQIILWIAVLSAIIAAISATFVTDENSPISVALRVLLIALPIISVSVMDYASRFAQSTLWVELRYRAEIIRSQIFLYRTGTGDYYQKNAQQKQTVLLEQVKAVASREKELAMSTPPYIQTQDKDLIAEIKKRNSSAGGSADNGLSAMSVDQYIDWRLHHQLSWYIRKVQDHYRLTKRYRILILGVAALGSVLVAFSVNLGVWVAATTAGALALQRWSELRMYGSTYSIYHSAAVDVQDALATWQIDPSNKSENQSAEFIHRIERIFQGEQKNWRDQAIQMLEANDESIMSNLQSTVDKHGIPQDAHEDLLVTKLSDKASETDVAHSNSPSKDAAG